MGSWEVFFYILNKRLPGCVFSEYRMMAVRYQARRTHGAGVWMTRLLFLPDDQTFIMLESPQTAVELVDDIRGGRWIPPEPYRARLAGSTDDPGWNTFRRGSLVIITGEFGEEGKPEELPAAPGGGSIDPILSPRQKQILQALAEGFTTKEIALQLGLRPRTVTMHVAAIKERLGAVTRAQSVGRAVALGICKLECAGSSPEA